MKDKFAIQYAVLTDATEEFTGLWLAVWEYVGQVEDEAEHDRQYVASIPLARQLLQEFISLGLIVLGRYSSWVDAQYTEVPSQEFASLLMEPSHWHPPQEENQAWISFYRTDKGYELWLQGKAAVERFLN